MRKSRIIPFILVIALFLSLVACSSNTTPSQTTASSQTAAPSQASSSEATSSQPAPSKPAEEVKVTLIYWGGGADSTDPIDQTFNKSVKDFNDAHKGSINVDLQYVSGGDYYTKLPAMVAANSAPDMFCIHASGKIKQYVDASKVLPIDSYLNADQTWKDSFVNGAFNLLTFNDKIYGVPWYSSTVPLFYNKDIFAKYNLQPPATYDDLKSVIKTLTDNKVVPFAFGTKDAWTCALFMEIVANRMGGDKPYNDIMAGGGDWTDPSFVKAGKVMQELVSLKAFPSDYQGLGGDDMSAMFKNGEAAMYVMGSWGIAQVYADDSKVKDKIGAAKFPSFSDGTGDPDTWLGQPSVNLAISASSKHPDQCIEFLKYWTSDPIEKNLGEACGQIPETKVQLDSTKVTSLALQVNSLIANSKGMFIFYDVGLGAKIGDEFNNTVQSICSGKDVTESLTKLNAFTKDNR